MLTRPELTEYKDSLGRKVNISCVTFGEDMLFTP